MNSIKPIEFRQAGEIPKGWGKEIQICNHNNDRLSTGYSGKILEYKASDNATSSMHFHVNKHETFYVLEGKFLFYYYDPRNADLLMKIISPGDVVVIPPFNPHRLISSFAGGRILEFATADDVNDNYRIAKGDSQKEN